VIEGDETPVAATRGSNNALRRIEALKVLLKGKVSDEVLALL